MRAVHARAGFTLIELMIVVAIIAIIAGVGIPKLLSARTNANEAAAIATLRALSSSQAELQSSGAIDTDADGSGEFGYFGELAGTQPLRVSLGAAPVMGTPGIDELSPSILAAHFGNVDANGWVTRSGYNFAIYLPLPPGGGLVAGAAELGGGGANPASLPDPNSGETYWCCYAWPVDVGGTGMRAFFVNDEGEMLQCQNRGATPFDGTVNAPTFDECYNTAGDMASGVIVGVPSPVSGQTWTPVHH
ncbi:MAG: prepilin-type N-terminal cleavage/methylation domain-containing protein [Planctomycetes bacterium]|nr:prepilin-type N-terminal cleavage/methylation domain-containing protein [Planctomycetota bacterium]